MSEERWVRRRFRVPERALETFTAELWLDDPLGLELRPGGVDVYYRDGAAPAPRADQAGVELEAEEVVVAEDWLGAWRATARPFALGSRFWIDPREDPPLAATPAGRIALRLPARRAFGTGSHPTTRLALSWLEEITLDDRAVLDVGAGSGILSLAARRLGARPVVGVERELESVLLAGANRRLNGVDASLVGGTVAALGRATFDLIVANLLSAHLRVELQSLAARLRSGGDFVYSGALTVERRELMALFEEVDLEPVAEKIEDEWSSWRLRAVAS